MPQDRRAGSCLTVQRRNPGTAAGADLAPAQPAREYLSAACIMAPAASSIASSPPPAMACAADTEMLVIVLSALVYSSASNLGEGISHGNRREDL
jgi:hypothetical protein